MTSEADYLKFKAKPAKQIEEKIKREGKREKLRKKIREKEVSKL